MPINESVEHDGVNDGAYGVNVNSLANSRIQD